MTHVLAVVTDRAHARFFDVGASEAVELTSLQSPAGRGGRFHSDRGDSPGWGEHAYHARREEEARRHVAAIVERLAAFERQHPGADVLLAGPGTTAGALQRALPPALGQRVIGTARLSPLEVTPATVHQTATQVRAAHERATQRTLVAAVLEGLGTGRAENGVRAVLRALARGQVRQLLIPADVADVFQTAADAARRQGASVTFLDDAGIAQPIEGLAALLRWP